MYLPVEHRDKGHRQIGYQQKPKAEFVAVVPARIASHQEPGKPACGQIHLCKRYHSGQYRRYVCNDTRLHPWFKLIQSYNVYSKMEDISMRKNV